jgi:hypothetical protein
MYIDITAVDFMDAEDGILGQKLSTKQVTDLLGVSTFYLIFP